MDERCEYSTLTVPNDPTYASIAATYVKEVARKIGFEGDEPESIGKAVQETLTVIIQRAFEPHEHSEIHISCERVPLGLRVAIRDQGLPFEPKPITECRVDVAATGSPSGENSVCLARGYVDDVEFHNLGRQGKETILVKYLKNRNITDYYQACELEPYSPDDHAHAPAAEPDQLDVRLMQPSEAEEVSRCVYRSYGYSYGYEHFYFPERIAELNQSGTLISVVAVTPTNEIVGHTAFVNPEPPSRTGELGMAVVKPEFRARGLLNRMSSYLVQEIRPQRFTGVFGRAVTNHTYSQQVGLRMGLKDCALELGYIPADVTFKGITERLSYRDSAIVHFMYLDKPDIVHLCMPRHHRDMILKLYDSIGMSFQLNEHDSADESYKEADSVVKTGAYTRLQYAHIDVVQYGRDVVHEVRSRLKEFCLNRFDVIHLYLNLHDPCTCRFTSAFEEMGFFFSGILPGKFPEDALILQYLNNVVIDYDRLHIHSQEGKDLRDYVRKHDPNV